MPCGHLEELPKKCSCGDFWSFMPNCFRPSFPGASAAKVKAPVEVRGGLDLIHSTFLPERVGIQKAVCFARPDLGEDKEAM